ALSTAHRETRGALGGSAAPLFLAIEHADRALCVLDATRPLDRSREAERLFAAALRVGETSPCCASARPLDEELRGRQAIAEVPRLVEGARHVPLRERELVEIAQDPSHLRVAAQQPEPIGDALGLPQRVLAPLARLPGLARAPAVFADPQEIAPEREVDRRARAFAQREEV